MTEWSAPQEPQLRRMPDEMRRQYLSIAVNNELSRGARVESQTEYGAIVVYGKPCNHVLHAIITLLGGALTCGILLVWGIVWIVMAFQKEERVAIRVDEYGYTQRQRLT